MRIVLGSELGHAIRFFRITQCDFILADVLSVESPKGL